MDNFFSLGKASEQQRTHYHTILARLQKNIQFDFDDELKSGDVRYKHLT